MKIQQRKSQFENVFILGYINHFDHDWQMITLHSFEALNSYLVSLCWVMEKAYIVRPIELKQTIRYY